MKITYKDPRFDLFWALRLKRGFGRMLREMGQTPLGPAIAFSKYDYRYLANLYLEKLRRADA
jgi:hypothetical protein